MTGGIHGSNRQSRLSRALDRATTVVAVLMSIYHLVACNINLFQAGQHINLHILFALVIVFLQAIKIKEGRPHLAGLVHDRPSGRQCGSMCVYSF